jgi:SAM-dependent methyltransferase
VRSLGIKNIFLDSEKSFVENYFDAAISLDVLEHIENDEKAFAYIASRVKSGGIIVIMVPTYMFLWGVQDEIAHHFRRYTMQSLIEVSKKAGDFEIVKKSYFNTFLFLPIALVRLWTRFFVSHPRDSDLDMNSPFVNRVLHWIFDIERKCLRHVNFPFGISALLILRKK